MAATMKTKSIPCAGEQKVKIPGECLGINDDKSLTPGKATALNDDGKVLFKPKNGQFNGRPASEVELSPKQILQKWTPPKA